MARSVREEAAQSWREFVQEPFVREALQQRRAQEQVTAVRCEIERSLQGR
jgi:hypothetical protein